MRGHSGTAQGGLVPAAAPDPNLLTARRADIALTEARAARNCARARKRPRIPAAGRQAGAPAAH